MHKEIEKAVIRITQTMEKNRKAYAETQENYNDTGFDRYWNKMEKLDAEYEELKNFLHQGEKIEVQPETIRNFVELKNAVKCMQSKWEHLKFDIPQSIDVIGIDEIFKDIKKIL